MDFDTEQGYEMEDGAHRGLYCTSVVQNMIIIKKDRIKICTPK